MHQALFSFAFSCSSLVSLSICRVGSIFPHISGLQSFIFHEIVFENVKPKYLGGIENWQIWKEDKNLHKK